MRLLGALAFAVVCLFVLAGRPGALHAADPVAPAPELFASDAPFTRHIQVSIAFVVPDEGGPVAQFRASNDDTTSGGVLSNGVSVPQNVVWTLASGPDGPRTVYGQVKYESGLWSSVTSLALTLDRTPASSLAVDIDSVGSRIPAPASFDWHTRTATPADRIFGQGSSDGTPDPTSAGVGDDTHFIILQGSDEPLAPGSYEVHRRSDFGCEDACVVVGAMGRFCEASGGSFTVTDVEFTPGGDLEVLDADFRVECIDTLMSGSIRYGSGRDIVALDQDRESLDYPDVTLGDDASRSVSFTNIGTTSTTLGDADVVGGERDDFAITSDDCSGATLAVGESCDVGVKFTPSDLGRRRAFLEIPDETPRGSRHVMVQGDGAAPTPPTAGTVIVAKGERCTATQSVKVRAEGATDAAGIDRLELSNVADDGFVSRSITPPQRWTLTAGDGRKTVYARWWNVAGQASDVVSDRILLDTTAPDAAPPEASIPDGVRVVDDRVRVRLNWTGTDATCGIAHYDISVSRNDHDWKRSGDDATTSHAARLLRVGPTYQFRVRGLDKADNLGDWAAGLTFRIVGTKAHPRIEIAGP